MKLKQTWRRIIKLLDPQLFSKTTNIHFSPLGCKPINSTVIYVILATLSTTLVVVCST